MARLILALLGSCVGLILAVPAILSALPFWILAAAVRRAAPLLEPHAATGDELIQFDPVLGWRPKPNLHTHYFAANDDIYPIVTDGDGWCGRIGVGDSEMIVVGDSFVSGHGTRTGEAFWELAPELKIKPIGCPGYDMVREVQALRQLGGQLAGKLVVWFICLENDIADSLQPHLRGYRKPFVRRSRLTGEWDIVSDHVRPETWTHSGAADLHNARILAALCAPGPLADHYYGACQFLIGQAAALCRGQGATLVVITVPSRMQLSSAECRALASLLENADDFDPDYIDVRLAAMCRELGVTFVPAKTHLLWSDYKRFEIYHWTPTGHRKIARLLRDLRTSWDAERRNRNEQVFRAGRLTAAASP